MIKVAIIGCGFMGRMHANVYGLLDNAKLVALVDRKPEKRESYSKDFGVPAYETLAELFANQEVDAVDVCLPTFEHKDATIAIAQAGKHVFCEKPMALTVDDADEMID